MGAAMMAMGRALQAFAAGLLLVIVAVPVFAQGAPDQTLFGPKQYLRTSSSPNQYTDSFTSPASVGAPFVLRIVNGAANGSNRISSAWIKVNGVQVAGPADFGQNVALVERTVNLAPNNTIEVRMASGPDGYLTVTALGTRILPTPASLAPNPLTIAAGGSGTLTATLAPSPTAAGALSVSSSAPGIAAAPASVPFGVGQTSVAIPVTALAAGSATVTASANGGSASATVNVNPAPVTVTSLAPDSLTLTQGANGILTATISAAQPNDTTVFLSSSNSGIVFVPSSVVVPAGAVQAVITVNGVSPGSAQVTATLNGSTATSQVQVNAAPPTVVSLLPVTATATLGSSTALTLTLSAAQIVDTVVPIVVSPPGIVSAPESVTVPAGQIGATFTVATLALGQAGITASLNGSSASSIVNVVPPPLQLVALEPATHGMTVGATSTFIVRINAAQLANAQIALSADPAGVLQVPASVTVAQGELQAAFTVTALATGDTVITASANNTSRTASVHVAPEPAAIVSLLPHPLPLQQGAVGSLTVRINVAQEADTLVPLTSSVPAVAQVPDSVTIPAGALSTTIAVNAVTPGSTDVTASVNGTSATARVDVTPPPPVVTAITPAALSLPRGTPGVLRVMVSRAPNISTAVTLASSNAAAASVPPTVNIPAGALFADFPVAANAEGQATITASLNGGSATAQVTVAAPELVQLTLSPSPASAYVGETLQFTATGTMTDGTTQDFTGNVTWSSSDAAIASIGAGGVATALAAGSAAIKAEFGYTAVQTSQPVTISASSTLTVKQPVGLVLSAPVLTLVTGESTTVTVTTSDPAPETGLVVSLSAMGPGAAAFPPTVTIPVHGTSISFVLTATSPGELTLGATAQNRLPGFLVFSIVPPLAITNITPASGEVGTLVTLTGTSFDPFPGNNQLSFPGINGTTVPAPAISATPTQITVKVPPLAESGPIVLTNGRGTTQSPPFTVVRDQDFQLLVSPPSVAAYQDASGTLQAQLTSTGGKPFTGLVSLSIQGLPPGVTATFAPQTLSALQAGTITLAASATAVPGTYPLTVRGEMKEGGQPFARSAAATLTVLESVGVAGIKGRFVTPQGNGIAGIIVRADVGSQPQTTTDAAGNFQLAGLPAGVITFRFDATPAHPLYPIWPQTINVPANKISVMEDWVISPPPPDSRFKPIVANSSVDQIITDERYPGLEIRIPAGVMIRGWDGVPKSRIAVERLDPDKLPVAGPPIKTKSVYQLYFGTAMGGIPVPEVPIAVTLPNDLGLEPGVKTPLWYYDGSPMGGTGEWKQGGFGTVSADGSVIVSDPGSGIPRFCGVCGLPCFQAVENEAPNPPCPDCDQLRQQYGKPITLATGQELESAVDLVVDGEVPIVISRVFNPFDAFAYVANFQQSLGVNWTFGGYDVALLPFGGDYAVRLVLPGNRRVDFGRGNDGRFRTGGYSTFYGAEIIKVGGTNPSDSGPLFGSTSPPGDLNVSPLCQYQGAFYIVQFKDGRQWRFDEAPNSTIVKIAGGCLFFLSEMRDTQGRWVRIARSDGKIQRVHTSSGQSVTFTYGEEGGVVSSVSDNTGRSVFYTHAEVETQGAFGGFGATTGNGGGSSGAAAVKVDVSPIPPMRLTSAITPEGTYSYTYEDDPPELRLGGLTFTSSGSSGGAAGLISLEPPTCQNVRGGARLKTIRIPGVPGVFTNYYGPSKRVLRQTWPDGTDIRFKYTIVGGCVPGLISSQHQPGEGKLILGSNTSTCSGAGCVHVDSWDGQAVTGGWIAGVEITDSRGRNLSQEFNRAGLGVKAVDENGQELLVERDKANRVTRMTDALGRTTLYEYDDRGNRTLIVDPAGRETRIEYDPKWSKPTLVERRLDAETLIQYRYTYDPGTGALLSSTDPENNVTTYEYDPSRRLALIRDPLLHETRIGYDGRGNPSRVTDTLGNSITMVSDTAGRIVRTQDALGNVTRASYNSLNQLTRIIDSQQGETRFNFDGRNNLESVVNPMDKVIESYGYDTVGRLVSKTDAHSRSETYGYDGNGNLTSITDRRLQTTDIAYDNANRPIRITYHDGTVQERTYDAVGRLAEIREPDNAQRMEYDNLDRLVRVATDTLAGLTSVAYEYDALDRRTKRTVTYPGGILEETVYVYDKASRLLSITQTGVNGTQATGYTWDAASRLTQKTLPNGIRQQLDYDNANRLLSITYRRTDDSILEQVLYSYDRNGQRTMKTVGGAGVQETPFSAVYDDANRMTSITLFPATPGQKTYTLTYDDHGNLASKTNAADAAEVTAYTWDSRNRLAAISMSDAAGTSTAQFKYDALGRRIERTISQGGATQRTQFVYDGIHAIGELVDGQLAATILTGLNIDEVIARTVNLGGGPNPIATKSYITDALGSVLAMTRADQAPEIFYGYSAYGETHVLGVDGNVPANSSQYTARESDGLIGGTTGSLYYFRARYYDPTLKRFISEDPAGLRAGLNFYAHADSDPISLKDPLGLWSTAGHNYFIREAYPNLSPQQIKWIQEGSAMADAGQFQMPGFSYIHNMLSPNMTQERGQELQDQFVQNNMNMARNILCHPNPKFRQRYAVHAYRAIGMALHPQMDSTSPAHTVNGTHWLVWRLRDYQSHGDWSKTKEGLDAATLYRELTISRMRAVFNGECAC